MSGPIDAYTYASDTGITFNIRLDASKAAAGGFSSGITGQPWWFSQNKKHKVRGVYGVSTTGKRAFLPCASVAQQKSIWLAGSFTISYAGSNVVFSVTSMEGEKYVDGE